ncbi:MAG: DUF3105 domain-containing protein [Haloarculaceae archaeon]
MPECDYCGASFDTEQAHLEHLGNEHEGELGPIDRRRVDSDGDGDTGLPTGPIVLLVVVFASAAIVTYFVFGGGSGNAAQNIETKPLPDHGDDQYLQAVQSYPEQPRDHVERGTQLDYDPMPPIGGRHYGTTISDGFYEEPQTLGSLVHSLEHGAVIVYYDPAAITPEAKASLQAYANEHTGTWQSVIVVPTPVDDPQSPYVLTAWRHSLSMDDYDARVVRAFLAEYLGRGPENPVR